jgi:hypothetical protein
MSMLTLDHRKGEPSRANSTFSSYIHTCEDRLLDYLSGNCLVRWVSHDIKFTIYVKLRIINISEEYHAGHSHMSIERLTTIAAPNDGKNNDTITQGFLAMP